MNQQNPLLIFCLIFLPLLLPLLRFLCCICFPLSPVQHIQLEPGENTMVKMQWTSRTHFSSSVDVSFSSLSCFHFCWYFAKSTFLCLLCSTMSYSLVRTQWWQCNEPAELTSHLLSHFPPSLAYTLTSTLLNLLSSVSCAAHTTWWEHNGDNAMNQKNRDSLLSFCLSSLPLSLALLRFLWCICFPLQESCASHTTWWEHNGNNAMNRQNFALTSQLLSHFHPSFASTFAISLLHMLSSESCAAHSATCNLVRA